jgi:mono/diheme cytochrome c family protein
VGLVSTFYAGLSAQAAEAVSGAVDMNTPPIPRDEAKKLVSPIPFSKASIDRGRVVFMGTCVNCHGRDGKAQVEIVANATDLTSPNVWNSGTSEGEIFRSIRDGAGLAMPPFKAQIHQEQTFWDLANFIRSLWPASMKPALRDDK